jgi:hypothetical protein
MTKVTHPVLAKLSKIQKRLLKNPIVRGLGEFLIALLNLSRQFYIANDTLHQDRPSQKRHPMRHI